MKCVPTGLALTFSTREPNLRVPSRHRKVCALPRTPCCCPVRQYHYHRCPNLASQRTRLPPPSLPQSSARCHVRPSRRRVGTASEAKHLNNDQHVYCTTTLYTLVHLFNTASGVSLVDVCRSQGGGYQVVYRKYRQP